MDTQLLLNSLVPHHKSPKYSTTLFAYPIVNHYQLNSNPTKMKNYHDEHHCNDGWTFEENKLFGDAIAEFDNGKDHIKEENDGKKNKEDITKRPRARAIPWKEEEHM